MFKVSTKDVPHAPRNSARKSSSNSFHECNKPNSHHSPSRFHNPLRQLPRCQLHTYIAIKKSFPTLEFDHFKVFSQFFQSIFSDNFSVYFLLTHDQIKAQDQYFSPYCISKRNWHQIKFTTISIPLKNQILKSPTIVHTVLKHLAGQTSG